MSSDDRKVVGVGQQQRIKRRRHPAAKKAGAIKGHNRRR